MNTEKEINEHQFVNLVMNAINLYVGQNILVGVRKSLENSLDLESKDDFIDNPSDTDKFEQFIKETIDKYGSHFTGAAAVKIAIAMISNSNKVSVPKYDAFNRQSPQ